MKYILNKQIFENESWAPLLNLKSNVDHQLINLIESMISENSKILEISCGNGADSFELKRKGYTVVSTENNREYYNYVSNHGINCIRHDTKDRFPFSDNSFDMVYSRLGLHYFTKEELKKIFSDINRITKYLVFTVKIKQDNLETGKIMISKNEWEDLVSSNKFEILSSIIREGILYDDQSTWLEISAKKIF